MMMMMMMMKATPLLLLLVSLVQGLVTPSHVLRKRPGVSTTARGFNNFFKKPESEAPPEPAEEEDDFQDGAYDAEDPVEKIFGFFFGKREEAPLGLCKFFMLVFSTGRFLLGLTS